MSAMQLVEGGAWAPAAEGGIAIDERVALEARCFASKGFYVGPDISLDVPPELNMPHRQSAVSLCQGTFHSITGANFEYSRGGPTRAIREVAHMQRCGGDAIPSLTALFHMFHSAPGAAGLDITCALRLADLHYTKGPHNHADAIWWLLRLARAILRNQALAHW